jgi:hypothetical protein
MQDKTERVIKANGVFCEACEKQGLKVCSFEEMPGYVSFVEGNMSEGQLSEQAKQEMAQFARTFSKYAVISKDTSVADEKSAKRQKAKVANKIYKKACVDSGKSICFFKNFSSWQEYVEGRIGDGELYERAVEEVRKAAEEGASG